MWAFICRVRNTRAGSWFALTTAMILGISGPATAIDVTLSMDEAKKALEEGRVPMTKALEKDEKASQEEVRKIIQQASLKTRVGADPEKEPCGTSAILRTKRYRLEAFGRQEAMESKKKEKNVRMPDEYIKKVVEMPNLEVEVQLCGDDEYFAEGVKIAFRQKGKNIEPVDVGQADRGRKNEGEGPAYRSRFTARFAYDSFDPTAKTKVYVMFPDGKMTEFDADLSKVK
ncbi:hypothetical protein YTPLAS18_32820 [Nitrospira sp.]|nr:hypothetical protein YTPLAS18_32820 [Nitrospira sp.]